MKTTLVNINSDSMPLIHTCSKIFTEVILVYDYETEEYSFSMSYNNEIRFKVVCKKKISTLSIDYLFFYAIACLSQDIRNTENVSIIYYSFDFLSSGTYNKYKNFWSSFYTYLTNIKTAFNSIPEFVYPES